MCLRQIRRHSAVHERLHWELCSLLAQQCCAGSRAALPKRARACILEALQVSLLLDPSMLILGRLSVSGISYGESST